MKRRKPQRQVPVPVAAGCRRPPPTLPWSRTWRWREKWISGRACRVRRASSLNTDGTQQDTFSHRTSQSTAHGFGGLTIQCFKNLITKSRQPKRLPAGKQIGADMAPVSRAGVTQESRRADGGREGCSDGFTRNFIGKSSFHLRWMLRNQGIFMFPWDRKRGWSLDYIPWRIADMSPP